MIIVDGHEYENESQVPNLGGLVCVEVINGNIRCYEGIASDAPYLPKYDDLGTGSQFLAYDTSEVYKYYAPNKTWYKL